MRMQLMKLSALTFAITLFAGTVSAQQTCPLQQAFTQPDEGGAVSVKVFRAGSGGAIDGVRPLFFKVPNLKVNTDGTRISYKADDPRGQNGAINNIRNAYNNSARPVSDFEAIRDANWLPRSRVWQVLSDSIIEKDARPGREGLPCMDDKGFLVSMTADTAVAGGFNRVGDCDQSKWIDAATVPALVIPQSSQFGTLGVKKRSVVVAMTTAAPRRVVLGIVGDAGPSKELGEASVAMNGQLNGLASGALPANRQDAIARFQAPSVIVMVLPGNANVSPRPVTAASVEAFAKSRFDAWGGKARLEACLAAMN